MLEVTRSGGRIARRVRVLEVVNGEDEKIRGEVVDDIKKEGDDIEIHADEILDAVIHADVRGLEVIVADAERKIHKVNSHDFVQGDCFFLHVYLYSDILILVDDKEK